MARRIVPQRLQRPRHAGIARHEDHRVTTVSACLAAVACAGLPSPTNPRTTRGKHMGKYFIAWLLGVPAILLVLLYFLFH